MARGLGDGLLRLCNGAWRDNDGDAVDIVEVVRCKDCTKREVSPFDGAEFCVPCGYSSMDPEWYCPEGERRKS